jgi:hypothetical protein
MFLPNGHASFTSSTQLQAFFFFFFFFFPILRFPNFLNFFGFFGIYTEKRKFPKISDIFKWPQCENLPPKKDATQLTRLPKAQCSHMYSSLSEEWLQANQVEHIDCLTQILEYSIQFLSSHTHIPPLSPRTPKHNSPIASGSVVNRLVEQGY